MVNCLFEMLPQHFLIFLKHLHLVNFAFEQNMYFLTFSRINGIWITFIWVLFILFYQFYIFILWLQIFGILLMLFIMLLLKESCLGEK